MAIDLPPPAEPLPFAAAQIRAYGDAAQVQAHTFGDSRIHVAGGPPIAQERIAAALEAATTPSDAVRAVAMAYYRAGYPATQIYYARLGRDLHLLVLAGTVESVDGPADLRPYFEPLVGRPTLTAPALEPARALAAVHAARSGRRLQLRLEPGSAPGRLRLVLADAGAPAAPTRLRLQLGNPGSRFVGRDFAEAEATLGGGGGELRVLRRQSLDGEQRYREHGGSVGLVSTTGIYAVEARRVDYRQQTPAMPLDGRVSTLALSWSGLPYADFQARWVAGLRLSAVRDTLSTPSSSALLEQSYTAAQFSLARARRSETSHGPVDWQLAMSADVGLDGDFADAFGGEQPTAGFLSLRPSLGLQLWSGGDAAWMAGLDLQAQYATHTLPRQQQFVLGGDQALAAWLPGVITADRGYHVRAHLSRPITASAWTVRPRLFAEFGGGHLDQGDAGSTNTDVLADAGLEIGVEYRRRLTARATTAVPLIEADDLRPGLDALRTDLFFEVSVRF